MRVRGDSRTQPVQRSVTLLSKPGQRKPNPQQRAQQTQDDRLQNLHTPVLSQQTNAERQDRSATSTESRSKSYDNNVLVAREYLVGDQHDAWKEGAKEETLEGDCHDRDVELGNEPEDELESHRGDNVGLIQELAIKSQL